MAGSVRAILWQHLHAARPDLPPCPAADPNDEVDAAAFAAVLDRLSDDDARRAAHAYAALWRRTFKTLVHHLRGRPRRALGLFVEEVYPFLRATRLAARTEGESGSRHLRVITPGDLPAAYEAGLIESFLGLSGADAHARADAPGTYSVEVHIAATDRLAVAVESVARLRVPLLLTAALAALVGVVLATRTASVHWLDATAAVVGTLAAQAGANAVHDLRQPEVRSPTSAPGLPRWWLWMQFAAGLTVAAAAMAWFLSLGRYPVVAFAAAGVVIAWLYGRLRDAGLGPVTAATTHGPVIVWGTVAAVGAPLWADPVALVVGTLPTALLAAAIVVVDDLADRPLDEAAGHRTLVVRLPPARHAALFAALVLSGVAAAGGSLWLLAPAAGLAAATVLVVPALALVRRVASTLGDPRGLAPARLATVAVYVAATVALVVGRGAAA